MKQIVTLLYNKIQRYPRLAFVAVAIQICVMLFCVSQLKIEEDISKALPAAIGTTQYQSIVESSSIFRKIIFQVSFKDTNENNPNALIDHATQFIEKLKENHESQIEKIQFTSDQDQVLSLLNLINSNLPIFLNDSDYARIDSSLNRENIDRSLSNSFHLLLTPSSTITKNFIEKDPLGWNYIILQKLQKFSINSNLKLYNDALFTADNKKLLFFVTLKDKSSESKKNAIFIDHVNDVLNKTGIKNPEIQTIYYGGCVASVDNANQIKKDSLIISIISLILFTLFFAIYFRNSLIAFYLIIPVIFGILFSLSIIYCLKGSISSIALAAGSVVFGIAINYSIHYFSYYKHFKDKLKTLHSLAIPLTFGSFTTFSGFLCLCFSQSKLLADIGLFAGLSLIGAVFFTLTFYSLFTPKLDSPPSYNFGFSKFNSFLTTLITYPKLSLLTLLGVTFALSFFVKNTKFNGDMRLLNFASTEIKKHEEEINKSLDFNNKKLHLLISNGNTIDEALSEQALLNDQVSLGNVGLLSDLIIPSNIQKQRIEKWNAYWTPAKKDKLISDIRNSANSNGFSITAFDSLIDRLNHQHVVHPITDFSPFYNLFSTDLVYSHEHKTYVTAQLFIDDKIAQKIDSALNNSSHNFLFSRSKFTNALVLSIQEDFNYILFITTFIVFLSFLISYGRIELALIAFIPMILTWIIILGIMGLFHIEFNIINIILSTFIFGIGDDYSVFTLENKLVYYKTGKDHESLNRESIYLSLIGTILSLSILVFAKHPALKSIALISSIGLFTVFIVSQILIPILFNFYIQYRANKKLAPYTLLNLITTFTSYTYFAFGGIILSILAYILIYPLSFIDLRKRKKFFHLLICYFTKSLVYMMFNIKKTFIDKQNLNFKQPSILIANHQSFLDILLTIMLNPHLILMVNKWVWESPIFGKVVQFADYIPTSENMEVDIEKIKTKLSEGYSILIFPEGTRSIDCNLKRFKKGAFYLSEQLKLDITPILIHGTGHTVKKGDWQLMNNSITLKVLPRIPFLDNSFGDTYQERTKSISSYFKMNYTELCNQVEQTKYWKNRVNTSYIYKGPIIEHYVKIKTKIEGYYSILDPYIPKEGKVTDIGSGMGYMIFLLSQSRPNCIFTGLDYDENKIEIAQHNYLKTDKIHFLKTDVLTYSYEYQDVFILLDVLHYFSYNQQIELLDILTSRLLPNGKIIIKDGIINSANKHKLTLLSEKIATKLHFNTGDYNSFTFIDEQELRTFCRNKSLNITKLSESKNTSNCYFLIQKSQ